MSKLYDQLKNAAFSRKQALAGEPPAPLAAQKAIDDDQGAWRDEIASRLQNVDEQLEAPREAGSAPLGTIQIPEFETAENFRGRGATMATLAEAALKRVEAETAALQRARERERAQRALHAQSKALLKADIAAAKAAREREASERVAVAIIAYVAMRPAPANPEGRRARPQAGPRAEDGAA